MLVPTGSAEKLPRRRHTHSRHLVTPRGDAATPSTEGTNVLSLRTGLPLLGIYAEGRAPYTGNNVFTRPLPEGLSTLKKVSQAPRVAGGELLGINHAEETRGTAAAGPRPAGPGSERGERPPASSSPTPPGKGDARGLQSPRQHGGSSPLRGEAAWTKPTFPLTVPSPLPRPPPLGFLNSFSTPEIRRFRLPMTNWKV